MKIVFVGAGRLATNFACALRDKGHDIVAVYSRTLSSAEELSRIVGSESTDCLDALPLMADAYIVAVKDSALGEVIPRLTEKRREQLFLHTAGSMPLSVFEGHAKNYGVIYPMQTFSKDRHIDFVHLPVFIEASNKATLERVRRLALTVTDSVISLSTEARRHLHLAAVFACNFVNHCYALSSEILATQGLPFNVMLPLIEETARKVAVMAPCNAQTGPAVRYDENVINAQLQLLASHPEMQQIYALMSQSIHDLEERKRCNC